MAAPAAAYLRSLWDVSFDDYRRDGAFAKYVSVPEHILYRLPHGFSYAQAALIEAVSIAVHAAKIQGSSQEAPPPLSVQLARQLGADDTFLGTGAEVVGRLQAVAGGYGPDIAVEAVGAQSPILTAIESVRRGGTVTLIGNLAPKVEIPLQTVVTRQLRLLGSYASAGEYPESIALMRSGANESRCADLGDRALERGRVLV